MVSAPVVETVAWLALAVVLGLGVALVVLLRRIAALARAHTDRKWEIAALRAEVAALRRTVSPADPPDTAPDRADDVADAERVTRSWPASATAWRRSRGQPAARSTRRRRQG